MAKKYRFYLLLFGLFLVSVLIRLNQLSIQVKSHEQTYILSLQTSEIWRTEGLINCKFTPMWTYPNEADAYMAYYKRLEDEKGHNYYVSFPPLSFLVAHIVLLPFEIDSGKLVLQIANLLLHFLSGLLIYHIVCLLFNKRPSELYIPAIAAYIFYVFTPIMIYLHTDIFFPEMIGQVLWILSFYVFLLIVKLRINSFFIPFIVFFMFLYAEWIGVFFIIPMIGYAFYRRDIKEYKLLLNAGIFSLILAGLIIFIQFVSISGLQEMLRAMGLRFLERSGFFGERYSSMGVHIFSQTSLKMFALNVHKAMGIFGYITICTSIVLFIMFRNKATHIKIILIFICLPLLLHWLVFFNANAIHLLLMPRIAFPLSMCVAFIFYIYIEKLNIKLFLKHLMCIVFFSFFILYAFVIYRSDFSSIESFPELNNLAQTIKNEAGPNESVFIITPPSIPEPEKYLSFQTKRNIVRVTAIEGAFNFMKSSNKKGKAVVFVMDNDRSINVLRPSHKQ